MNENKTCQEKYNLVGLDEMTKFSNDQIAIYCPFYAEYSQYDAKIDFAVGVSMAITGAVGLGNNILTFVTFSSGSDFQGPSFLYHKAIALLELLHMVIIFQFGIFKVLQFPGNTYWMIWWRDCVWGGTMFSEVAKLAINILVMFISLERTVGVWLPLKFDAINRSGVSAAAITVSIIVGTVQLLYLAAVRVVLPSSGDYGLVSTDFGNSAIFAATVQATNVIKVGLGGVTFLLCVLVALGLYRSGKKALQMSNDAKTRWRAMKMSCYLQLILGVTTVVANVLWVWFKIVDMHRPYPAVGRLAVTWIEFDDALSYLPRARFRKAVELAQVVAMEMDHGGRFYFYLMFHGTFRDCFKNMWRSETKVTTLSNRHNHEKV